MFALNFLFLMSNHVITEIIKTEFVICSVCDITGICTASLVGVRFVLINTNINQNLSLPLKNLHYPLSAARYPFLGKTRYVDCAQLKEIALDKFSDRYRCQSFGKIDDEDLLHISEAVKSSPLETKKHLRRFGLSDV